MQITSSQRGNHRQKGRRRLAHPRHRGQILGVRIQHSRQTAKTLQQEVRDPVGILTGQCIKQQQFQNLMIFKLFQSFMQKTFTQTFAVPPMKGRTVRLIMGCDAACHCVVILLCHGHKPLPFDRGTPRATNLSVIHQPLLDHVCFERRSFLEQAPEIQLKIENMNSINVFLATGMFNVMIASATD